MGKEKQKNPNAFIWALILIIVILSAFLGHQWLSKRYASENITKVETTPAENQNAQETSDQNNMAPDFTVTDMNGNEAKLSDYLGAPIVLNFWASWCSPCQSEMPEFQSVYESNDLDVAFLMVSVTDGDRETLQSAREFIDEEGYTFPVFFDTELSAADAYGVMSIPVTYFIDAQGYIVAVANGPIDEDTLLEGIGMIAE